MDAPAKMQTVGEATSSIKGVVESTFSSLAKSLNLSKLRDSFLQNIIYILIVIVILIGVLVYIQMVEAVGVNPLNPPEAKEIKKIQIQKVVEGFDMEQNGGIEEFATNIDDNHGENLYENKYHDLYHVQDGLEYGDGGSEDLAGLSSDVFHNDDNDTKSKKNRQK